MHKNATRKLTTLTTLAWLAAVALMLAGCGKKAESGAATNAPVADGATLNAFREKLEAYYAEHGDFFVTATPNDLPSTLEWEYGTDLPEVGSPQAKKGGTLNLRLQEFPLTLRLVGPDSNSAFRPYLNDDVRMGFAVRHPNSTELGPTGYPMIPGIAKAWAVDRENKTVYVRIDPKARWSDGPAITTADVFFLFYFYQSPHIQAPWYNNWYGKGEKYDKVTRYDEHTFSITLTNAKPDFPSYVLGLEPLPHHFFVDFGEDFIEKYQWRFIPTSGAYTVQDSDVRKGQSIALTRNKDWWANDKKHWRYRYNFDRVLFRVIRETPKAFQVFESGELDYFGLNLPEYQYEKLPDAHSLVQTGAIHKATFYNEMPNNPGGLWLNTSQPRLDNPDIRKGIHHSMNYALVSQTYFRGDTARRRTSVDGYGPFSHPELRAREFSIEEAQAYFAKAGYTKRGTDGILVNERGERLSFQLSSNSEALKDVLGILEQEARKVGLELRIEVLDAMTGFKKVNERKHEIFLAAYGSGAEMYPRYWEFWHSSNAYDNAFLEDGTLNPERKVKAQTNNLSVVAIAELDALIAQYDNSTDVDEMQRLAHRMEEIIHENASLVPGLYMPFYRLAYWRWIKWPEDFNVRLSESWEQWWLHWIDEEEKAATLRAIRRNEKLSEPVISIFGSYEIVELFTGTIEKIGDSDKGADTEQQRDDGGEHAAELEP